MVFLHYTIQYVPRSRRSGSRTPRQNRDNPKASNGGSIDVYFINNFILAREDRFTLAKYRAAKTTELYIASDLSVVALPKLLEEEEEEEAPLTCVMRSLFDSIPSFFLGR
jgi:hypothetical protein